MFAGSNFCVFVFFFSNLLDDSVIVAFTNPCAYSSSQMFGTQMFCCPFSTQKRDNSRYNSHRIKVQELWTLKLITTEFRNDHLYTAVS